MPRKSKPKTTPTAIYTIPFTEPFTPLPVTPPSNIQPTPPPICQPQLSEPEEEHQYRLRRDMALDGYSDEAIDTAIARLNESMALGANEPSLPHINAMAPTPITVEYSLADLAGEQESSREQIQSQPLPVPQAAPLPVPATPAEQGPVLPRITRHRGQTVQTFKAIYVMTPIQYRAAFDKLKVRTRRTGKEVICEAIGDCAVKHGLASEAGAIMGWPDWD